MTHSFRVRTLCLATLALTAGAARVQSAVRFEENLGQTSTQVRYLARTSGKTLYFGDRQLYVELWGAGESSSVVRMSFAGSDPNSRCQAAGTQFEPISYFIGSDPSRWVRGARQFSRIEWKGIYPGIDAVFYGDGSRLEYDLVLARGADPAAVRLRFDGGRRVRSAADGAIEIATPAGTLWQRAPRIYQEGPDGSRHLVRGGFISGKDAHEFRLRLAAYNSELPLVVDPVLELSTYLGGENDDQVKVVGDGFVAGNTSSVAFQGAPMSRRRSRDIFIRSTRPPILSYSGLFGTMVIGGSGDEDLTAVASTNSSRVEYYLAGATNSRDFPMLYPGGAQYAGGATDAFLVHIQFQQYFGYFDSILIGGSGEDRITALVPYGGSVFGVGVTDSPDLPVKFAFQPALAGGKDAFFFTAGFSSSAPQTLSYLGGSADDAAYAVTLTGLGLVVAGETQSPDFPLLGWPSSARQGQSDGFVALLTNVVGPVVQKSMLIGGSGEDRVQSIATAFSPYYYPSSTFVAITGTTTSPDFPLVNPSQDKFGGVADAFLARLDLRDGTLSFSTFLGGSGAEEGTAVAVDTQDNIAVAGVTHSVDLPVFQALQPQPAGGEDGFFAYFDANNRLRQLTYFGGSGDDHIYGVALTNTTARIAGSTTSTDLPMKNPWQDVKDDGMDGFVADIGTAYIIGPNRLSIGKDMAVYLSLSAAENASSVPLTLRSSDPSKVRFSQAGKTSGEVTLLGGYWNTTLEGLTDSGQVDLVASAEGLPSKTITVTLTPTALQIFQSSFAVTTWSPAAFLYYGVIAWNPVTNKAEGFGQLRDGLPPLQVSWSSSDESVAKIVPDNYVAPVGPGTAQLTLSCTTLPVLPPDSLSITVLRPGIRTFDTTIGKDLQTNLQYVATQDLFSISNIRPKGSMTFRSSDPSRLLLSFDPSQPGQESLDIDFNQPYNQYLPRVWAQALSSEGQVKVLITSTEIAAGKEVVITLARTSAAIASGIGSNPATAYVGNTFRLSPRFIFEGSSNTFGFTVRGGLTLHYSFSTSDPKVVSINPASGDTSSPVTPSATAVSLGTADLRMTLDSSDMQVDGLLSVAVKPVPPSLPAGPQLYLGKNLRTQVSLSFRLPENLEAVITVADPTLALLSPDGATAGQAQIRKQFTTYGDLSFWVYGLASAGQTAIRIQIAGVGTVDGTVTLAPSGFAFSESQRTVPYYSSGSVPVASYALDDLTGIPLFAQPLRPGVQASLSLQQDGTTVALSASKISFASDTDITRTNVAYTVKGVGDTYVWFDAPAGFTAPSRRARVRIRIAPSTIGFDRAPLAATHTTIAFALHTDSGVQAAAQITATSGDPAKLLVGGTRGEAAGSAVISPGSSLFLTALADSGTAPLHLTGPNLEPVDVTIPLYPLQVSVSGAQSPMTLLSQSAPTQWGLSLGVASFGNLSLTLRPGDPPLRVEFTSTDAGVVSVDPAFVEFTPTRNSASVTVKPGVPGSAAINLKVPSGYTLDRTQVAVTVRAPKFMLPKVILGKDLQGALVVTPEFGGEPLDNKILTLTSLSPDRLLLSRASDVRGAPSLTLAFPVRARESQPVYLQALAGEGEASIRIAADGYADSISTVVLAPSALVLNAGPIALDAGGPAASAAIFVEPLPAASVSDVNGVLSNVRVRPGAPAIEAPLSSADPSVASVEPSRVKFNPGDATQNMVIKPVAAGTTTVTLGVPDGFADPGVASRTVKVQVTLRTLNVNCNNLEIGKDAQESCITSLPSGVTATAVSSQSTSALVSFDSKIAGSARATAIGPGTLWVQALSDNGSVDVTLSAPGYRDAKLTFRLRPSVFVLADTTLGIPSIPMSVGNTRDVEIQFRRLQAAGDLAFYTSTLRPGVGTVVVDVTSLNPAVLRVPAGALLFGPGEGFKTIRLTALAPGSAGVRAATPPGFAAPPRDTAFYIVQ